MPDKNTVVGVDVGGTKILIGLVERDGTVVSARRFPIQVDSSQATLHSLDRALAEFMQALPAGAAPSGVGIGLVGHTDPHAGVWLNSINLHINQPVPLGQLIFNQYGLPVALDNDVHAATLAEMRLGAGQGLSDFVYLNAGTGIAAGLVVNGQLVRGSANYAGELGHWMIEPEGELCACGQHGCLEPIASGAGILAQVRARLSAGEPSSLSEAAFRPDFDASAVFRAAEAGDRLAAQVAGRAARALGIALTGLVNLLNPALIVYGGGVVSDGWLMQPTGRWVREHAMPVARSALQGIVPSPINPGQTGLLGAACLAWDIIPIP
jgi:glucokinase